MIPILDPLLLRRRLSLGFAVVGISAGSSMAGFTTFEATGVDPASITAARDAFRAAVGGGSVAGANGSFGGLRREINWDGVANASADPSPIAANFFNVTSPRGAVFSTPGTGFLVSANTALPTPTLFGFPADFQAFSAQRLFTAINSPVTDVSFFLPGTATAATTTAFGLVFVDIEVAAQTSIQFFDVADTLIYSHDALVGGNQGLTFLGAVANAGETIGRVRITSGLNTIVSNGVLGNLNDDIVVMDDFLFAEPAVVPEASHFMLPGLGLIGFILNRCRRHRELAKTLGRP